MPVLYHRMLVILPAEAFGLWLTGENTRLAPAPENLRFGSSRRAHGAAE